MKALSLTQPWAALLAVGAKTIETRDWPTSYRGWFAIHASKGFPSAARDFAHAETVQRSLTDALRASAKNENIPWLEEWFRRSPDFLPTGAIIGVAHLSHCEPTTEVFEANGNTSIDHCFSLNVLSSRMMNFRDVPKNERVFGDYRARGDKGKLRHAFWTTHAIPLLEPIPCAGSLGFWDTRTAYEKAGGDFSGWRDSDGYDEAIMRELAHRGITLPMHGMSLTVKTRGMSVRDAADKFGAIITPDGG